MKQLTAHTYTVPDLIMQSVSDLFSIHADWDSEYVL